MSFDDTLLSDTVELAYEVHGSGNSLVLVHGFPLDASIWQAQVEVLKGKYQIITPYLRGHGSSPAPPGTYSVALMARDIFSLLAKLGISKAPWVGHSMGGYITLAAYRLAPYRVTGVGLIASNHLADSEEGRAKRLELVDEVVKVGAEAAVNPKLYAPSVAEDDPRVLKTNQIMRNTAPEGIIGALLAMATRPDSTDTLKNMTVPALIVGGAHDQLFPAERPQEMADLLPDAELVIAERSGHMPMLEEPEVVTQAIDRLMARIPAK